MSLLDRLERKFGRYAVPYVTEALIVGQVLLIGVAMEAPDALGNIDLSTEGLANGEFYRLLTFLMVPPSHVLIFSFIVWLIFFMFGRGLEQTVGLFRYNVYLLVGFFSLIAVALLLTVMGVEASIMNRYLLISVFLAFAYHHPNHTVLLFFILPVKVKWVAMIFWIFVGAAVLAGSVPEKLMAIGGVGNFLIFYTADIIRKLRGARRRAVHRMEAAAAADQPFHTCTACGATDKTHPDLEFRYCGTCAGAPCYCEEHIFNHEHINDAAASDQR